MRYYTQFTITGQKSAEGSKSKKYNKCFVINGTAFLCVVFDVILSLLHKDIQYKM